MDDTEISFDSIYCIAEESWKGREQEAHATELLKYYLQWCPNRAKAWMIYGDSLRVIGRSDEAYSALTKAYDKCREKEHAGEGQVASSIASLIEQYKSPEEAKKWYQIAADAFGNCVGWIWVMRGINLAILSEFEESAKCFKTVIQSQTEERDEAFVYLGRVYRAMGRYKEAIDCFQQALAINALHKEAKGMLIGIEGINETLNMIHKTKLGEISHDELYNVAKEAWHEEERELHVVELLRYYLRFYPENIQAQMMYGDALRCLWKSNEAYSVLTQAFGICQQNQLKGDIAIIIAKLVSKHVSPQKAKKWYDLACELLPSASFLWMYRGVNLAVLGEFDKAKECYDTVIQMHDELEDEARLNLGLVYRAMAKYDEAIDCFRQALVINPTYKEAQDVLHGLEGIHDTLELIEKHKQQNEQGSEREEDGPGRQRK